MQDGEHIKEHIKEWLGIDNEMKVLQQELKNRRQRKKELTDSLVSVLKETGIDGWDTKDGKLEYCKTKTKSALNKQHIKEALLKFISNPDEVETMTAFIFDSRGVKEKESIKRK
jgi:hypothetical protein